jgi:hypothetical protein
MKPVQCAAIPATVILGLIGFGTVILSAGQPENAVNQVTEFAAKFIIVTHIELDKRTGIVLEKAKLSRLDQRWFIVGSAVDQWSEDRWVHGLRTWLPVDQVLVIQEVASIEDAKKLFERRMP